MNIIWKGSPNHNKGRGGVSVKKIVIHWFGKGTLESANDRFQNPANQVSAHYGISKGRIWQWVKDEDTAWHCGAYATNRESIGIEHDAISGGHSLSDQDYALSSQLIAGLAKKLNIPLDRKHIIGHREVKATACPGTIDLDRIINKAKEILNEKVMYKQKILILTSKIDPADLEQNKIAFKDYASKVLRRTNGEFQMELTFQPTEAVFKTIHGTGSSGSTSSPIQIPIVYVDPANIVHEGRKAEIALGQEFDLVCLLYDPRFIVGDQPTNPVHNPIYLEGFTTFQIPSNWIGNDWGSANIFFSHEHCHTHTTIIGSESGTWLTDKTHGTNPYQNHPSLPEPNCTDFFIDQLIELKPYWKYLGSPVSNERKTSVIAFEYKGTVYVPVFRKFIPIADADTFDELGGDWGSVKKLTEAEFNSIIVPFIGKKTILS